MYHATPARCGAAVEGYCQREEGRRQGGAADVAEPESRSGKTQFGGDFLFYLAEAALVVPSLHASSPLFRFADEVLRSAELQSRVSAPGVDAAHPRAGAASLGKRVEEVAPQLYGQLQEEASTLFYHALTSKAPRDHFDGQRSASATGRPDALASAGRLRGGGPLGAANIEKATPKDHFPIYFVPGSATYSAFGWL